MNLTVHLVNYKNVNDESFDSTQNFSKNKPVKEVVSSMVSFLKKLKQQNIVASQVDVVGHSMGGLVARSLDNYYETRSTNNYKKGYIHRLITIGTPHNGSPIADYFYNNVKKTCKLLSAVFVGINPYSDANKDLIPNSTALRTLGPSSFKTYAISATDNSSTTETFFDQIFFHCSKILDKITLNYKVDNIMGTSNHDVIVSQTSQEGNINAKTSFMGTVHMVIGEEINTDTSETISTSIMAKVKSLLLGDSSSFEILPAPQAPANYIGFQSRSLANNLNTADGASDEIVITSPTTTNNIVAGSSVTITVTGENVTFTDVVFADDSYFVIDESSPFSTSITAPYKSGEHIINISAFDGTTRYSKNLVLSIIPSSTLVSLSINEDPINIPSIDFTSQITVTGTYADSSTIDLTSAASGTTYSVSGDGINVISVSSDGLITPLSQGSAVVTIENGGKATSAMAAVGDSALYIGPSIPTLSEWGMLLFIALLLLSGVFVIIHHGDRFRQRQ